MPSIWARNKKGKGSSRKQDQRKGGGGGWGQKLHGNFAAHDPSSMVKPSQLAYEHWRFQLAVPPDLASIPIH